MNMIQLQNVESEVALKHLSDELILNEVAYKNLEFKRERYLCQIHGFRSHWHRDGVHDVHGECKKKKSN